MESVATIGDARLQQKTYCYSENAHFEVVGTNEVYRFSLGNVLRFSDRCLHIAAIFYLLISTGCSESSVPEDTVLYIPMRLRGTYSEAHTAFYEHIEKYLQLKQTNNPALALAELKKAVWIQYEGHPKSDEYLILLFELYQINVIRIVFPFCKSTENRHVPAPSLCFRRTIDTFSQPLLQELRAL